MYANDSKSSLRLAMRPRCACTLAYLIVPLQHPTRSLFVNFILAIGLAVSVACLLCALYDHRTLCFLAVVCMQAATAGNAQSSSCLCTRLLAEMQGRPELVGVLVVWEVARS